jgi:hypothetical protein
MANEEHLAILKQGVSAWNAWRNENLEILPDLSEVRLSAARLAGVNLFTANLRRANLNEADLNHADLREANLRNAKLGRASLCYADLLNANIFGADLNGANLALASFLKANLGNANLSEANLSGTNLTEANLNGANFTEAGIQRTTFGYVDLSAVQGLNTARHIGPSTIGIDTLYRSHGNIPETFLRGCGAPDEFITYVRSLVGHPFEYHSCFISYSSKDTGLAERLYADLQTAGVRCWYAPEDMKIGDKFRSRIDEAIHLHDKLLFVLSKHSLASPWVEKEVETAFAKETKEQRSVLFPVRVDQAIMQRDTGWAADIHRTRYIGDFRRWKNHDTYWTAFDRLLGDLKAAGQ